MRGKTKTMSPCLYDSDNQIIKQVDYNSFSNIINDTNPSIQTLNIPFTFAGGLYDKDTKLIKFGYREYDSITGRWITKDPIDFSGGDSNLYGYVLGDPVNGVDVEGLNSFEYMGQWLYDFTTTHFIFDTESQILTNTPRINQNDDF
jgi:RHS repeat-associated protein